MHRFAGTTLAVGVVGAAAMLAVTVLPAAGTNAGEFERVSVSGGPAFSPDPCAGTYVIDSAASSLSAPRLPVRDAIWSPDAREIAGIYEAGNGQGWQRPVIVNLATGRARNVAPGAQSVIAWGRSGVVISGPDPRHPRVGPVGWWVLPAAGTTPIPLGRSLVATDPNHEWAAPVSPSGRYIAAISNEGLVVIDIRRPAQRVAIPAPVGTVHVGWTPSDQMLVAAGDKYGHPTGSIRVVRPSNGAWAGVVARKIKGSWSVKWAGDGRSAFILTDEVYRYAGNTRKTTRAPTGWLLTTSPRIRVGLQPAWSQWKANHPEDQNWPTVLGMSNDGRQIAISTLLHAPQRTTRSGSTVMWHSLVSMVDVKGASAARPVAAGYNVDSGPDSEFSCSFGLTVAPIGTNALLHPMGAGCGPRRLSDHLRETVETMVPWLRSTPVVPAHLQEMP